MPTSYPLYKATGRVVDGQLTQACADPGYVGPGEGVRRLRGEHGPAVEPAVQPDRGEDPADRRHDVPEHRRPAERRRGLLELVRGRLERRRPPGTPGPLFQYHHQPFNYFANYAPGQPGPVAPQGRDAPSRPPPSTGTLPDGQLRQAVRRRERAPRLRQRAERQRPPGRPAQDDHRAARRPAAPWSSSPTTSSAGSGTTCRPRAGQDRGRARRLGSGHPHPGARARPRSLRRSGVDHTVYDTTSILATIERSFGLAPLSTRDAAVNDLRHAVAVGGR